MQRLIRLLCALVFGGAALIGTAQAQDWATRADCAVPKLGIDPAVLPAAVLAQYQGEAAQRANSTGRFWQITSPGGTISHLWGTYHSTHPLILDLPEHVEETIAKARLIAPEIDFIRPTRAAIEKSHDYEGWFRKTDRPFRLSPENTGIPEALIERMRTRTEALGWERTAPDYLTLGGLVSVLLNSPCDDFAAGVLPIQDDRIQMLGMIGGAEVMGLEDPDSLLRFLNNGRNRATALSILRVYAAYLQPSRGGRATDFTLYKQGQIGVMMAWDRAFLREVLGAESDTHLKRTDDYMLALRNQNFLQRALPELNRGGVFMAIGAFHLPGETGMIAMLRNAGFTLTRIPTPSEVPPP